MRYVNKAIISHWIKSDIFLAVFFPGSAKTNVWGEGWETKWSFDGKLY